MKEQAKPVYFIVGAVVVIVLVIVLFRNFIAEAPLPHTPTREEEMKYMGQSTNKAQQDYQKNYQKQPPQNAPSGPIPNAPR